MTKITFVKRGKDIDIVKDDRVTVGCFFPDDMDGGLLKLYLFSSLPLPAMETVLSKMKELVLEA